MLRQTVLVAGNSAVLSSQLKESLERRFGRNHYLVLFAKDRQIAQQILQQIHVDVFIFDGKVEHHVSSHMLT